MAGSIRGVTARRGLTGSSRTMKRLWDERARRDAFRFIEWNPKHWHGDVDAFFRVGEERTSLLVDPVLRDYGPTPGAEFAVEVGCGVGRFARALAARFGHVIGVDVSQEMIRKARELNPPTHFPNLAFAAGDGVTLPRTRATCSSSRRGVRPRRSKERDALAKPLHSGCRSRRLLTHGTRRRSSTRIRTATQTP